jgi:hypothetical protein
MEANLETKRQLVCQEGKAMKMSNDMGRIGFCSLVLESLME